jgi:hypothetical protein
MREFPPYQMLDLRLSTVEEKTRSLEKLYHNTLDYGWNGKEVLRELVAKHGGIHVPEEKRAAIGRLFTFILWGELAAWHVAADLARELEDTDAKLAATGQVFDEARHFYVLRDYLTASGVPLPPLNPLARRVLLKILDTRSPLQKLSGMQLLVETLALAIFKKVAETRVEPVLTDLLGYIERDESRHVGLGVLYLPKLLARATPMERARLGAFTFECFLFTIASGRRHHQDFIAVGIDHRDLAMTSARFHHRIVGEMAEAAGLRPGQKVRGVYGLSKKQHQAIVDFLQPEDPARISTRHRRALAAMDRAISVAERAMS